MDFHLSFGLHWNPLGFQGLDYMFGWSGTIVFVLENKSVKITFYPNMGIYIVHLGGSLAISPILETHPDKGRREQAEAELESVLMVFKNTLSWTQTWYWNTHSNKADRVLATPEIQNQRKIICQPNGAHQSPSSSFFLHLFHIFSSRFAWTRGMALLSWVRCHQIKINQIQPCVSCKSVGDDDDDDAITWTVTVVLCSSSLLAVCTQVYYPGVLSCILKVAGTRSRSMY